MKRHYYSVVHPLKGLLHTIYATLSFMTNYRVTIQLDHKVVF